MIRWMINAIVAGLLLVFTVGCTTTHVIKPNDDLNIAQNATLTTTGNTKIDVKAAYSIGDSIVAIDYFSHQEHRFHKSDVPKIVVTNRLEGALKGLLFGAVGGAALGFLGGDENPTDALAGRGAGAIIFGGMGAMFGPLFGAIVGSNDIYIIESSNEDQTISVAEQYVNVDVKPITSNRERRYWYAGRDIGVGSGQLPINSESTLMQDQISSGSGSGGVFEIGLTVNPKLLIGIRMGGYGDYQTENNFSNTRRDVSTFFLAGSYFPKSKGLFYRGGLGYSSYSFKSETFVPSSQRDEILHDYSVAGIGGEIGLGYAFWMGRSFNLTLSGNIGGNYFKDAEVSIWKQYSLGLMWY